MVSPKYLEENINLLNHIFFQATIRRAPPQTVAQRERQLENARRQEMNREETVRNLAREKMLESNMNRETRLEDKRFLRQQQQELKEREMEDTILKVMRQGLL